MEIASTASDWVGILGIAGTLIAGISAALITFLSQKYALDHQEKHRYQDHRLSTYADFCGNSTKAVSAWLCGRDDVEAMSKYLSAHTLVKLVGSEKLRAIADEVHSEFASMIDVEKPLTMQHPNVQAFNAKIVTFAEEARKELGVGA